MKSKIESQKALEVIKFISEQSNDKSIVMCKSKILDKIDFENLNPETLPIYTCKFHNCIKMVDKLQSNNDNNHPKNMSNTNFHDFHDCKLSSINQRWKDGFDQCNDFKLIDENSVD